MYKQIIPIILANCIPLVGVFIWDWESISVFGIYILETLIIGVFHAIKMGFLSTGNIIQASIDNPNNTIKSKPGCIIPFFLFHFMFFVFVQTILVFGFSNNGNGNFFYGFNYLIGLFRGETGLALAAFSLISLTALINDLLHSKEIYASKTMEKIMMEPYPRIFVQQFVVIIGGGILMMTQSTKSLVLIFIIVKVLAELVIIYKDHPRFKALLEKNTQS
jgi:hypothetical protein